MGRQPFGRCPAHALSTTAPVGDAAEVHELAHRRGKHVQTDHGAKTRAASQADAHAKDRTGEAAERLARSGRTDALGAVLARAVLQRYRVNPMPQMTHQWRFGLGLFFDPNCGWYAQVAALRQRAAALGMARHFPANPARLLPNPSLLAFSPHDEGADLAVSIRKPNDLDAWEALLQAVGPVIVSGMLGGADWGTVAAKQLGVGHFVLIVGADAAAGTLDYLDPLQGNTVRTGDYARLDPRIDDWVAHINDDALMDRIAALRTG